MKERMKRSLIVLLTVALLGTSVQPLSLGVSAAEISEDESQVDITLAEEYAKEETTGEETETQESMEESGTEVEEQAEEQEKSQQSSKVSLQTEEETGNTEEAPEFVLEITGTDENGHELMKVNFHEEAVVDSYLLILKQEEKKEEAQQEETQEEETQEEDQPIYTYKVLDPSKKNTEDGQVLIYHFSEKGEGILCKDLKMVVLSWFIWNNEKRETSNYLCKVAADGAINLFTGVYEEYHYVNGIVAIGAAAGYKVIDGYLYKVDEDGKASKYMKDAKKSGVYIRTIEGVLYRISYSTGKAVAYGGIYEKHYYKSGKIAKGSSYFAVYKSKLYKVAKDGTYILYKKTSKKALKKFYGLYLNSDMKYYVFLINPKTGSAKKYAKDKKKDGSYFFVFNSKVYKITYKTGLMTEKYSGIYKSRLYLNAKFASKSGVFYKKYVYHGTVLKKSKSWYAIYGNYVYKVEKNGSAKIYIKNAEKDGTYAYTKGATKYTIEYKTGLIVDRQRITDDDIRASLVEKAQSFLGYSETSKKKPHKEILNIYNAYKPLPRGYKVQSGDAWCATYVSAMFIDMGYASIFPVECSCLMQVNMWKNMGRWKEKDSYVPKPGDIIYYDWQDSGSGDNKGVPDHVGIVVESTSKVITVIEGNKNDRVEYRTIEVNGKFIRGFGLPNFSALVK